MRVCSQTPRTQSQIGSDRARGSRGVQRCNASAITHTNHTGHHGSLHTSIQRPALQQGLNRLSCTRPFRTTRMTGCPALQQMQEAMPETVPMPAGAAPRYGASTALTGDQWLQRVQQLLQGEQDADDAQDVGNVVAMEHINLEVEDLEAARMFYAEGLGLTPDPGTLGGQRGGLHVVWYNVGAQQLHIARGPRGQRLPQGGCIGMVLPDVEQVAERLEAVQKSMANVSSRWLVPGVLQAHGPYGNTFLLHQALPGFPGRRGIAYIALPCHTGTAAAAADFYRRVLGARVRAVEGGAQVLLGAGCRLLLREDPALGPATDQAVRAAHEDWHVAMYVADFSGSYRNIEGLGLVNNNHPYRDKCHSLQDALRNHQFRFTDVPMSLEGGGPAALRMGHEVRSMHHPRFMRCLYNRGGPGFDV